jgi:hypothetical protein
LSSGNSRFDLRVSTLVWLLMQSYTHKSIEDSIWEACI